MTHHVGLIDIFLFGAYFLSGVWPR